MLVDASITEKGVEVHYTLNGEAPSAASLKAEIGKDISVPPGTVALRARTYVPGMSPSRAVTLYLPNAIIRQASSVGSEVASADDALCWIGNDELDPTRAADAVPTRAAGTS